MEVTGLGVSYGGHVAVHDVSFEMASGEAVALVGRNGAGKSSLLKALAGLEHSAGNVIVHGIHCHHGHGVAPIAYVPQRSSARWELSLTVAEVVVAGCRARGSRWRRPSAEDRDRAREALQRFGIENLRDRPVGALSGGQAQRVLLARAFAQEPRILLLDEPFAGLDSVSATTLSDSITDLSMRGMSVLCAMHELAIAREVFPRTIALDQVIIANGPTPLVLNAEGVEQIFVGSVMSKGRSTP
ncbi:MAG TPA: hypothetical protein DCQ36_00975 [Actinobacteria bacterium]|nr:hypothetical protein [Actinomycetota bacterium]